MEQELTGRSLYILTRGIIIGFVFCLFLVLLYLLSPLYFSSVSSSIFTYNGAIFYAMLQISTVAFDLISFSCFFYLVSQDRAGFVNLSFLAEFISGVVPLAEMDYLFQSGLNGISAAYCINIILTSYAYMACSGYAHITMEMETVENSSEKDVYKPSIWDLFQIS
mgnify:CR=1 FL=1